MSKKDKVDNKVAVSRSPSIDLLCGFQRELDQRFENYLASVETARTEEHKQTAERLAAELRFLRAKFGLLREQLSKL